MLLNYLSSPPMFHDLSVLHHPPTHTHKNISPLTTTPAFLAFAGYGSKRFPGIVTKVDKIDGVPMYRINYDDGDAEHVDKEELLEILVPDSEALAADSGQKRKREPPSARKYGRMSLAGVSKSKSKPKDKVKEKRKSKGHGAAVEGEAEEEAAQDAAPAREPESERIIVRGAARHVPDAMASPPASSWVKTGNLVFVSDIVGWSRPDTINTQVRTREGGVSVYLALSLMGLGSSCQLIYVIGIGIMVYI
jgi:hypothetical protein